MSHRAGSESRVAPSREGRRFRFQLAPLVDLLLIVVFAQMLEIRQTVTLGETDTQQRLNAAEAEMDQAERRVDAAERRVVFAERRADAVVEQTNRAIRSVAEAFRVEDLSPDDVIEWTGDESAVLAEQVQRITREVADASPQEVVRFLIGHAELLKRAEIWHLHADEKRRILLNAGETDVAIQLERRGQDDRTEELEDRLFAAYKQLPQPKGLVVILVSYSPESVAGVYQPMVDGMPKAVERMRTDLAETRFEYTVLGSTPLPDAIGEF
ncbi:MAG: hypothetical protein AAF989_09690 [Planctomycetota bacterium]